MQKTNRKPIFVLIIPRFEDISSSFYAGEITKGVNLAASRLNANILTHIVDRGNHKHWLDPSLLDHKHVDGILFADIDNDVSVVERAIKAGMPCLVLNNLLQEPINCISIDNLRASFEIVDHLIRIGHRRIATITGDMNTQAAEARLEGYYQALRKHEIKVDKKYIKEGFFLRTPAREAAERLLKLKEPPTAIFAASDVMALEVIDVAKQNKLNVPKDISVVGFDDNPINIHCSVKLTTVAQPLVEMGRIGLEQLSLIAKGKAQLPVKMVLPARLIKGKSISPA